MTAFSSPRANPHRRVPTVRARYHNLVDARRAMRALVRKGVDGDDLSLVGPAAHAEQPSLRRAIARRVRSSVGVSFVIGVGLGAAMKMIMIMNWPNMGAGWTFGLLVGWFAAAGALLGGIGWMVRTVGSSEPMPVVWDDEADPPVWLAVYGRRDAVRPGVEATHPEQIVDDPITLAS